MISKKQQKHVNTYISKAYDRINLTIPKGEKETVKAAADKAGQSVNGYIYDAIRQRMDKETE